MNLHPRIFVPCVIAIVVIATVLAACGTHPAATPIVAPTPIMTGRVSTPTIGYVFCDAGGSGSGGDVTKIAVVGYRVMSAPSYAGAWATTTTTNSKVLTFGSACWYTENPPNFSTVWWQS